MKINLFTIVIAAIISVMLAWAVSMPAEVADNAVMLGIGGFVSLFLCLGAGIGMKYEAPRTGANIKVLSLLFVFIFLVEHLVFALVQGFNPQPYIIITLLLICIYLLAVRGIYKSGV
jgi:hypothetical protein